MCNNNNNKYADIICTFNVEQKKQQKQKTIKTATNYSSEDLCGKVKICGQQQRT